MEWSAATWDFAKSILTVMVSALVTVILTRMQLKARATLIAAGANAVSSQRLADLESANVELREALTKCEEDRKEWLKSCEEWERQKVAYQDDIIRRDRMINQLQAELNDVRREQDQTKNQVIALQQQAAHLQDQLNRRPPPRRGGQP